VVHGRAWWAATVSLPSEGSLAARPKSGYERLGDVRDLPATRRRVHL
jgi:hypothetical protein